MKHAIMLSALVAILLVGCEYEAPLTKEHSVAVDPAVLGVWESIPDEGEETESAERMVILKYSDTEYMVHYPVGADGLYYRCYLIKIEGASCVQVQAIGARNGPPAEDEKELFHVVSYRLTDGILQIRTLNTDLVVDELKTTEDLMAAFLAHKDDAHLFVNPGRFRRIEE
jgi:hypothetical protein